MNQQPDKIFRDKLHDYQKPVTANAWAKLESKLDQKRGIPVWMKVAATLLLLLASTALFVTDRFSTTQVADIKPEKRNIPEQTSPVKVESPVTSNELPDKQLTVQPKQNIEQSSKKKQNLKSKTRNIIEPEVIPANEIAVTEKENTTQDIASTEVAMLQSEPTDPEGSTIVLVYSASEVNQKYLIKKDTTQATTETKKPSTIQKLWSKAKDLKRNQDPFGELRQKKNEILALDFKREEQRNQNR